MKFIVFRNLLCLLIVLSYSSFQTNSANIHQDQQRNSEKLKPISPKDYEKWESLRGGLLSDNGNWLVYSINRNSKNNELRLHDLKSDSEKVISNASRPLFSKNNKWLAYTLGYSPEESKKLKEQKKTAQNKLGLLNLDTGDSLVFNSVTSFSFSGNSEFIAMKHYASKEAKSKGANLVIHEFSTNKDYIFGNVSEHNWKGESTYMAMIIDAEGKSGNGIQLFNAATGEIKVLDSKDTYYKGLTWRRDSDDLAVFRVEKDENYEDSTNVILIWQNLGKKNQKNKTFKQNDISGFPENYRIVNSRNVRWGKKGESLYFNIIEWLPKLEYPKLSENPDSIKTDAPPDLQIWHSKDVRIIPEQQQLAERKREDIYTAVWHIPDDSFVQIADDLTEITRLQEDIPISIGLDASPYEFKAMFGRPSYDLYSINNHTGKKELLENDVYYVNSISPDAKNLIYVKNDQYFLHNLIDGKKQNLTGSINTSFVNDEDDHPIHKFRPYGFSGWSDDSKSFFVNSKYDVWQFFADGSSGKRITNGETDKIVYRIIKLDREQEYIDPKKRMYFSLYGEWTKNYGYSAGIPGKEISKLVWLPDNVSGLMKAKDSDTFAYMIQDFDDSPDYFITKDDFETQKQISKTNPFQKNYAWGKSELIEYTNHNGKKLQGALFYPAGYQPGIKYPMITYIYEITSTSVRRYSVPTEGSYYNHNIFTSQGYFVLQPDIVFDKGDPGISSVRTMEAAVKKVVDMGLIDKNRVGLVGHSWGGYQSAYAVTQTDIFAAAVAGAGLTDFFSMYGMVAWDFGGTPETFHFEVSQERMKVPPWEDIEGFVRNSPVLHVHKVNTPILFEVGDNDKNVDWRQGIEYYNTMRRAGKQMVLLVYAKEGHGLRQDKNRIDYQRRILQWFAHYLKAEPAKEWILKGIPYTDQMRKLENWKK